MDKTLEYLKMSKEVRAREERNKEYQEDIRDIHNQVPEGGIWTYGDWKALNEIYGIFAKLATAFGAVRDADKDTFEAAVQELDKAVLQSPKHYEFEALYGNVLDRVANVPAPKRSTKSIWKGIVRMFQGMSNG